MARESRETWERLKWDREERGKISFKKVNVKEGQSARQHRRLRQKATCVDKLTFIFLPQY